jgi:hypothetical protein
MRNGEVNGILSRAMLEAGELRLNSRRFINTPP